MADVHAKELDATRAKMPTRIYLIIMIEQFLVKITKLTTNTKILLIFEY